MNNPFSIQPPRLNRPDRQALWLNIMLAVGAVILINGLIFSFNWDTDDDPAQHSTAYEVSGVLVGSVWIFLFAGMATARWLLNVPALIDQRAENARWWISVLIVNCLAYPFYSLAIGSIYGGLAGNVVTIALAVYVARRAWLHDRRATALISLIGFWVLFATYTIFGQLGWLR